MPKSTKILIPRDRLYQWYVQEQRSYRWIMRATGTNSARGIRRLLNEHGIPIRGRSEAIKTQWIDADARRLATAERAKKNFSAFWGSQTKRPEVRAKISASKMGSKNPMFGKTGEKHHHFLGGKKTWDRGRKIPSQRKKEIIAELGGQCARCGTHENLTINHKIPWREVRHHELWNLEPLCKKCHFSGPNRLR